MDTTERDRAITLLEMAIRLIDCHWGNKDFSESLPEAVDALCGRVVKKLQNAKELQPQ